MEIMMLQARIMILGGNRADETLINTSCFYANVILKIGRLWDLEKTPYNSILVCKSVYHI